MTQKTRKQNKEAENEEVLFILIYSKDTGNPLLSHCLCSMTQLFLHQLYI